MNSNGRRPSHLCSHGLVIHSRASFDQNAANLTWHAWHIIYRHLSILLNIIVDLDVCRLRGHPQLTLWGRGGEGALCVEIGFTWTCLIYLHLVNPVCQPRCVLP